MRPLHAQLETMHDIILNPHMCMWSWLTRHSSWLMNRFSVRVVGREVYEEACDSEWNGYLCFLGVAIFSWKLRATLGPQHWSRGLFDLESIRTFSGVFGTLHEIRIQNFGPLFFCFKKPFDNLSPTSCPRLLYMASKHADKQENIGKLNRVLFCPVYVDEKKKERCDTNMDTSWKVLCVQ